MIEAPENCKGHWNQLFGNDKPIYIEIGSGKGQFIRDNGLTYKERNFIGVEGQKSVAFMALRKIDEAKVENVKMVTCFVDHLTEWFEEGELDGIYLNFSDPWPKERHAKRRLTYGPKLLEYCKVCKDTGFIQFKTDNDQLFDYTLSQIEEFGLTVLELSRDLHQSNYVQGNIMTEYEEKFSRSGKNINYVKISGKVEI